MAQPFDIDAYLARINYAGPRTPAYDTLTGILRAHIASIPFESFDVLLRRPIRLDPEALQTKMVTCRRGGYCFEHASLMYAALDALDFAPVRHASRVLLFEARHESVRQHMFLTVIAVSPTSSTPASAPSRARSPSPWTAPPSRQAHRATASPAKATIGSSTSLRTTKKSKAGPRPWKRNNRSISG